MPFRAKRSTKWLDFNDKVVRVLRCSKGANHSYCNGQRHADFTGYCKLKQEPPNWKNRTATIWARHKSCDTFFDWDDGKDQYAITLKNGWVFKKIWRKAKPSSSEEKINMPDYGEIKKSVLGTSLWSPKISWEIGVGRGRVEYSYWVQIEGPQGIPYDK